MVHREGSFISRSQSTCSNNTTSQAMNRPPVWLNPYSSADFCNKHLNTAWLRFWALITNRCLSCPTYTARQPAATSLGIHWSSSSSSGSVTESSVLDSWLLELAEREIDLIFTRDEHLRCIQLVLGSDDARTSRVALKVWYERRRLGLLEILFWNLRTARCIFCRAFNMIAGFGRILSTSR